MLELPLRVNPHESRALAVRFEAGRQLYHAVLGEALRRLDLMQQSRAWAAARKMPQGAPGSPEQKNRAAGFSRIAKTIGFTDYAMQAFATKCKNACWIGDHLDAHTTQKIGTRAFQAAQRYSFRTSGRPSWVRLRIPGSRVSQEGRVQLVDSKGALADVELLVERFRLSGAATPEAL
ncbi:transposase IS605 OrfB, partial [mine drainage metagenome]